MAFSGCFRFRYTSPKRQPELDAPGNRGDSLFEHVGGLVQLVVAGVELGRGKPHVFIGRVGRHDFRNDPFGRLRPPHGLVKFRQVEFIRRLFRGQGRNFQQRLFGIVRPLGLDVELGQPQVERNVFRVGGNAFLQGLLGAAVFLFRAWAEASIR